MALFGRRKASDPSPSDPQGTDAFPATQDAAAAESAPESQGPWDASERRADDRYLDFGALKILPTEGIMIRVEADPSSESIVAVTVEREGSTMQLQGFAAPKSPGIWDELRQEIAAAVKGQNGSSEEVEGEHGPELLAKIPQITPEGRPGYRTIRFIGVERPRWFLRAVLSGPAAVTEEDAAPLIALLQDVIVDRGREPLPPRSLLGLSIPDQTPENVAPVSR